MEDIAAKVGVSQATVSYVLGGRAASAKVSPRTRQRIMDTAQELGYRRNQLARAMVTGKSRILGVITASEGDHVMRVLAGALAAANEENYLLKILHVADTVNLQEIIQSCVEWRLGGVLAVHLSEAALDRLQSELQALSILIAMVDDAPRRDWGVRVVADNEQGSRLAVEHLVALGHRRIALLGGSPGGMTESREKGFRDAMTEAGLILREPWIRQSDYTDVPTIEQAAHSVLHSPSDRPTAIVCGGDGIAMVLLRVARAAGLKLPEDLSVTGFANFYLSRLVDPPLTTIDQPFRDMGAEAVKHLIRQVETEEPLLRNKGVDLALPTRLLIRASTAPVSPSSRDRSRNGIARSVA